MQDTELQELIDRQGIINLLDRCTRAIHGNVWSDLKACLTTDVVATLAAGDLSTNQAAIVRYYEQKLANLLPSDRFDGEYEIVLADDVAHVKTIITAEHRSEPDDTLVLLGFSQRDQVRRSDGVWLIARRQILASWRTDGDALDRAEGLRPA